MNIKTPLIELFYINNKNPTIRLSDSQMMHYQVQRHICKNIKDNLNIDKNYDGIIDNVSLHMEYFQLYNDVNRASRN